MYSVDHGRRWSKVVEYSAAAHGVELIGSSPKSADVLYLSVRKQTTGDRAVYRVCDG